MQHIHERRVPFQVAYGGHGYSHIVNNVLPRLKAKGLTQQQIGKITVANPANWIAMA